MKYFKSLILIFVIVFSFFALNTKIGFADDTTISSGSYENPYSPSGLSFDYAIEQIKQFFSFPNSDGGLAEYIQSVVKYLLSFVSLVAVIYIIYAGFRMMIFSSSGDSEAAGKSKKIIAYVVIGILIMWLAYSIVSFIINVLNG